MSDKKVDVEIVDDDGNILGVPEANESEVRAFDKDAAERLKEFESRFEAESRKARELEAQLNEVVRFAQGTVNENKRLNSLLSSGEKVLLDQAGSRVKAEMAAAEQAFKKAYEEGDTESMLKAQKAIADLTHQMHQVQSYTPVVPAQIQQPIQAPAPQRPQVDAKSEAWIRKNESWWMKDQPMTGFAMGVHTDIVRQGVEPGTDKYIEELDRRMSEAFPDKFQSAQAPRRRTVSGQSAVAPATRTAGGKTVSKVTITPSMVSIARRLNVPVEAYAEELARMNEDG
jgi:hypothetical protein